MADEEETTEVRLGPANLMDDVAVIQVTLERRGDLPDDHEVQVLADLHHSQIAKGAFVAIGVLKAEYTTLATRLNEEGAWKRADFEKAVKAFKAELEGPKDIVAEITARGKAKGGTVIRDPSAPGGEVWVSPEFDERSDQELLDIYQEYADLTRQYGSGPELDKRVKEKGDTILVRGTGKTAETLRRVVEIRDQVKSVVTDRINSGSWSLPPIEEINE